MIDTSDFSRHNLDKNRYMLTGQLRQQGYDWWWHSFTGIHKKTGKEKAFFIEFFVCNPALGGEQPIFGQLTKNQQEGKKPSYLMVKAGCWGTDAKQIHRFFAWDDVEVEYGIPFAIRAEDCYATENRLQGSVCVDAKDVKKHPEYMCDAGQMQWDLRVKKEIPFNVGYGTSKFLRKINAFEMYWHAEGMKTLYEGTIMLDGEEYEVIPERSYGYADKNWGANFTTPWVWLSSNHLKSKKTGKMLENSVFDIGGGKPRVFGIPLNRILLGAFYYEGERIEFNFSKLWTGAKTKFACHETEDEIVWHVQQENRKYIMLTNIHCKKEEMLLINYEAPDGTKKHNRLWNGGTGRGYIRLYKKGKDSVEFVDEIIVSHVGCEYGEMN
ncbi:MAG: tocopherol cyclase family protein [Eubacteriales bacterium]|nr:tocopherol cyclase family protein [Eubacteriales bacterium]